MVFTHDLKSCGESLVGSSPTPGTTQEKSKSFSSHCFTLRLMNIQFWEKKNF